MHFCFLTLFLTSGVIQVYGKIVRGTPIADSALPMLDFRNRPGVYGKIVRGTPIAVI